MRTRNQERHQSAEPAKRSSKKRRASSASVEVEGTPSASAPAGSSSSSQSAFQVQNKRRKKLESSPLYEEEETIEQSTQYPQLPIDDDEVEILDERESYSVDPTPRHVRFSETAESSGNGATSTHLTPHVNKHKKTVHRRITLSPATLASSNGISGISGKSGKSSKPKSRASLPPNFSLSQGSSSSIQELQFAPLSQILQERVKRRLRRSHLSEETNSIYESNRGEARARLELQHLREDIELRDERVHQLLYELEMQRQLGIDVSNESDAERQRIKDMETELATLRQEIEEKREQEASLPQLDGADDADVLADDMMIINSPVVRADGDDVAYPALPSSQDFLSPLSRTVSKTEDVIVSDAETQAALSAPESNSQVEREREAFEEAIRFWTREAADAKAALQILTIELQSLGFGDTATSPEVILASIRESYQSIRGRLEKALPGQVPADLSNRDIVEMVAEHLESLADRVATQEAALRDADTLQQELVREVEGLIERLTEAEVRKRDLERNWSALDRQTQEDEVFIAELEDKLKEITKDHGIVQGMLNAKNSELLTLVGANKELDVTVDKLGLALDGYRVSEEKLQTLIERMEAEHRHALTDLEAVHKTTVDALEVKLNDQTAGRDVAEQDADEKQAVIVNLELRVAQDEASLESLRQQLAAVEQGRAAEELAREVAEGEVEQKTTFIEQLEVKVESAEAHLEELRAELEHLRELNEAEKRQREAAEEELDDREVKIEDLNKKLHDQGIQANQLRQKLFEIQTREKDSVQRLEQEAQDREEQFQDDMAREIARREEAEATAASRNVTIVEVEEALRQAEAAMRETLGDRDNKITELAALADRLEAELENTTKELDQTITELETLQTDSDTRIIQLTADILALQTQAAEQSATISNLESEAINTAELHSTAIVERDTAIADLNHEIFQANNRIILLESEKQSLEGRVESEAESMLELQASKDEEIAALKETITIKQEDIENLKMRADDVDKAWEKLLTERDEEIEVLKSNGEETTKTVMRLTKLNASLKEKLRKFVRDSTFTAQAMQEDVETALNASAQKTTDLRDEGMRVLEEVEAMDTVTELVQVEVSSSSSSAAPKNKFLQRFKRASKGKRQYDSGIGIDEGDGSMLME